VNFSHLQKLSFLTALIATLGSLYFSEIALYPPCVLCWYQRICMYPLTFILFASVWTNDSRQARYTLPLIFTGLLIAIYHNLLYYEIIPDSITPCTAGISCTSKHIEWLGFITIPFLSLTAFFILLLTEGYQFLHKKRRTHEQ